MRQPRNSPFLKSLGERRIEGATWALLVIWIGVMMLFDGEPEGVGELGAGAILLSSALIQAAAGWSAGAILWGGGAVLIFLGLDDLLELDLGAAVVIAFGLYLLWRALGGRSRRRRGGPPNIIDV